MLAVLSLTPLASGVLGILTKSFSQLTGLKFEKVEAIAVPYFFMLTKRLLACIFILFLFVPASMSSLCFRSMVASISLSSSDI